MKRTTLVWLALASILLAAGAALAQEPAAPQPAAPQAAAPQATESAPQPADPASVDDVIAKAISAMGGRDAWKAVKTVRMSGKMSGMMPEATLAIEYKRPSKVRVEFALQGMTGIQAFDGENGWMLMPFMGQTEPQKMDPEMAKMIKEQGEFESPLLDYKEKGHAVELVGKEDVEGTPAYKIKLTRASGDVDQYYVDAEHFLIFRQDGKRNIQGQEIDVRVLLGDYKQVGDLLLPHSMETSMAGGPTMQAITLEKIEINAEIADDRFAMPPPKEEPSTGEGG